MPQHHQAAAGKLNETVPQPQVALIGVHTRGQDCCVSCHCLD